MLSASKQAHCNETSININGQKRWQHTVGTDRLTHYAVHEKRGIEATIDIGILPKFDGTMIHDHWKSYFKYNNNKHSLCNAHHLRELRFIHEQHRIKWAKRMSAFLLKVKSAKER